MTGWYSFLKTSGLTRDLGLDVSILGGAIESIAGRQIGRLRVSLSHPDGVVDEDVVRHYLARRGVGAHL